MKLMSVLLVLLHLNVDFVFVVSSMLQSK